MIKPISNHTLDKKFFFPFPLDNGVGLQNSTCILQGFFGYLGAFSSLNSTPVRAEVANCSPGQMCFVWQVQHEQNRTLYIKVQIFNFFKKSGDQLAKSFIHSAAMSWHWVPPPSLRGPRLCSLPQVPHSLFLLP